MSAAAISPFCRFPSHMCQPIYKYFSNIYCYLCYSIGIIGFFPWAIGILMGKSASTAVQIVTDYQCWKYWGSHVTIVSHKLHSDLCTANSKWGLSLQSKPLLLGLTFLSANLPWDFTERDKFERTTGLGLRLQIQLFPPLKWLHRQQVWLISLCFFIQSVLITYWRSARVVRLYWETDIW